MVRIQMRWLRTLLELSDRDDSKQAIRSETQASGCLCRHLRKQELNSLEGITSYTLQYNKFLFSSEAREDICNFFFWPEFEHDQCDEKKNTEMVVV